jgi:hypothetical protein
MTEHEADRVSEWFIESLTSGRFGGWTTEAGPFESSAEAASWLEGNRHKLMWPECEQRIIPVITPDVP